MGKTKIEWTDVVWNPVTGCDPVSIGCDNCYSATFAKRFWKGRPFSDVQFHPERLELPLHWKNPRRIFVDSMGDLFHPKMQTEWLDKIFWNIGLCPHHKFLILTKRILEAQVYFKSIKYFYSNLWLGVSVENQQTADERIPILLSIPTAKRFVSYEPALGPIDFGELLIDGLDWLICGGETGRNARPCHQNWIRSVRDQCVEADTPFFFKGWGEWSHEIPNDLYDERSAKVANLAWRKKWIEKGLMWNAVLKCWQKPCDALDGSQEMFKVGKSRSGCLLDGKEWKQFPKER